jgi:hypothetical protein
MASASAPWLSVIVELDNLLHGEASRAPTMFDRLARQIREIDELRDRVEIFAPFNEEELAAHEAEAIVRPVGGSADFTVELVPARGLRYYELKNEGARRARGEILLFVDSDVLPEEGWLRQLLDPFRDDHIDVVAGNSYVDRDTFYARAFALGWYFPPRLADGPLTEEPTSIVNTIAMRRHVFEKYPFPEDRTLYMDQGIIWAETLNRNEVRTYLNPRARVAHPPPRFVRSAFINGHDLARRTRRPGESKLHSLRLTYWGFRANFRNASRRIRQGYREVGLSRAAVPPALVVVGSYWALWALAELLTRWAPRLIPHRYLR